MRHSTVLKHTTLLTTLAVLLLATSLAGAKEQQLAGIRLGQHAINLIEVFGQPDAWAGPGAGGAAAPAGGAAAAGGPAALPGAPPAGGSHVGERELFVDGSATTARIHHRDAFAGPVQGPAIIEEPASTTFIPATWEARLGPARTILLTHLR